MRISMKVHTVTFTIRTFSLWQRLVAAWAMITTGSVTLEGEDKDSFTLEGDSKDTLFDLGQPFATRLCACGKTMITCGWEGEPSDRMVCAPDGTWHGHHKCGQRFVGGVI